MNKVLSFILLGLFFVVPESSWAQVGHDTAKAAGFKVQNASVQVSLDPGEFRRDQSVRAVVSLTDAMSGGPVLDADIYILFNKEMSAPEHNAHEEGMVMTSFPGTELDFGDPQPVQYGPDISSFTKLLPTEKAGIYAAPYTITEKGTYNYTIAIKSLAGKSFIEPLFIGGALDYQPRSRAPVYRMLMIIGLITMTGFIMVWFIRQRNVVGVVSGQPLNLLAIPSVGKFFRSAWFQPAHQIPALIIFIVIIAVGLFDVQTGDRNIATILMWTIWWAAIIFTFVFSGRVWCMMCPFGAAQDWIGKAFSLNRKFPRSMQNIWLSSFLFLGLTWWDSYSGIVNKPALTSLLLIGFFVVAAGMASVFKGRAFCRSVCPIGGLIGLYSMFSPVELRNQCIETCRGHLEKECIKGSPAGNGCPMFQTPMTLDRNNYCNFCSECVKTCSQNNIVIRFRSFAKDLWVSARGYIDEAYLAMVLVGVTIIMTGEMIEPWHRWMDGLMKILPLDFLGIESHLFQEKATFLVIFSIGSLIAPILLLVMASLIVRRFTGPSSPLSVKMTAIHYAYMFIPVGIGMHLAHNVSHLVKEGPGIIPAVQRFMSVNLGLSLGSPEWDVVPLMGNESIYWLQMFILIVMNIFSLYAGYRISVKHYGDRALRAFVPMMTLVLIFMAFNSFILGQPMSLRHSH